MWNRFSILKNGWRKTVRRFFLHFTKLNMYFNVIFFVEDSKFIWIFHSTCSKKSSTKLSRWISRLNLGSILKYKFSFSFISYSQTIKSRIDLNIIMAAKFIWLVWSYNIKIADWWMMRYLFNIYFCTIW